MTMIGKSKNLPGIWALLLILASGIGCGADHPAAAVSPETVRDVSLLVAQPTAIPEYTEAPGTVRAAESSQLASQTMGTIVSVNAHEGSRVERGQVLVVLDDAQARAGVERATAMVNAATKEVAAAESEVELARTTLQRYQTLIEKKSVSPQEFEEIKTRFTSAEAHRDAAQASRSAAEAALAQARVSLEHAQIRAPFAGLVTSRLVDPGTLATPGMPLLTVENPSQFRLEAFVNESEMAAVRLGGTCGVVIDALGGKSIPGKVSQLVPAADPATRTVLVKIDLPAQAGLQSGLFGRARFPRGERKTLVVPKTALVERGQLRGVYVVGSDQIASLRFVTLGDPSGDGFEVLTGLDAGERVVANATGRDLAGRRVEVR
jgi:RND family efflux transporter MFP subunit